MVFENNGKVSEILGNGKGNTLNFRKRYYYIRAEFIIFYTLSLLFCTEK